LTTCRFGPKLPPGGLTQILSSWFRCCMGRSRRSRWPTWHVHPSFSSIRISSDSFQLQAVAISAKVCTHLIHPRCHPRLNIHKAHPSPRQNATKLYVARTHLSCSITFLTIPFNRQFISATKYRLPSRFRIQRKHGTGVRGPDVEYPPM
jgi:hypothetical protein